MSPELIATIVVGVTQVGLIVAIWRDLRANMRRLREEIRADTRRLRAETRDFRAGIRAGNQSLRADIQSFRAEVRADNQSLRRDIQALTVRMARLEGRILGLFVGRGAPRRQASRSTET